jgi:hypothetical protein
VEDANGIAIAFAQQGQHQVFRPDVTVLQTACFFATGFDHVVHSFGIAITHTLHALFSAKLHMASLVPNIMPKHGLERRAGTEDSGITGEKLGDT